MEETAFSYSSQPKKSNKIMLYATVGVIVIIVLLSGYFLTRSSEKTEEKKSVITENISPSPIPTEKPKIEKSTVKIQVINGTGTPGQAGLVVKALEDAGYSTDNIKTGNAEKYDNATTSITARDNFEEIVTDIKDSLKSTFEKITVVSPNLDKDSEFDIIVVTGGKIFEEATPTSTPSITVSPTPLLSTTPTTTPAPTLTPIP